MKSLSTCENTDPTASMNRWTHGLKSRASVPLFLGKVTLSLKGQGQFQSRPRPDATIIPRNLMVLRMFLDLFSRLQHSYIVLAMMLSKPCKDDGWCLICKRGPDAQNEPQAATTAEKLRNALLRHPISCMCFDMFCRLCSFDLHVRNLCILQKHSERSSLSQDCFIIYVPAHPSTLYVLVHTHKKVFRAGSKRQWCSSWFGVRDWSGSGESFGWIGSLAKNRWHNEFLCLTIFTEDIRRWRWTKAKQCAKPRDWLLSL